MKKIIRSLNRYRPILTVAVLFALNVLPAFAQSTTFSSTDLKAGIR